MDTQIIAQRATGREALARIIAAIDDGAPSPTTITSLDSGAILSYHRRPGRDSYAEAAAMVRVLEIAAEPYVNQFDGYHSVTWETWQYDPTCRWAVTAFVDDEPAPGDEKYYPVALAAFDAAEHRLADPWLEAMTA